MIVNDIFAKEIVYTINGLDQIDLKSNLVYTTTETEPLLMDVYTPSGLSKEEKLPAVIFIHGESSKCSNMKDAGQYKSLGKLIAASGLTAVTFNHRMLLQKSNVREIYEDINDLMTYVQEQADYLNIDKHRIAIWCISGGVPFGLSTAIKNHTSSIKCAVAYYGFGNLDSLGEFFNLDIYEQDHKLLSPTDLLYTSNSDNVAPMFIARAGLDNPIINKSLDTFIIEALSHNLHIDFYNHTSGHHAFDLFDDNNRTHEIIHKTIEFLKIHLYKYNIQ